jgi:hypothetical protein
MDRTRGSNIPAEMVVAVICRDQPIIEAGAELKLNPRQSSDEVKVGLSGLVAFYNIQAPEGQKAIDRLAC